MYFAILLSLILILPANALSPSKPRKIKPVEFEYSDDEINTITNVVNGEVGGIVGTVILTYADGTQLYTDGCTLHRIHAKILENQIKSELFPSNIESIVGKYWSKDYISSNSKHSTQWEHCRQDVVESLTGGFDIPDNVFAATCDPYFAQTYTGYKLFARVYWDTGWCSGTFYYYAFDG